MKSLLLACLVVTGCIESEQNDGDEEGTVVEVPDQPHTAACTGSRFQCFAQIRTDSEARIAAFAAPSGFGATTLAQAYHLAATRHPTATIAIVDAFDYANAESDLAAYRAQYGLPPCTTANGCLRIVNQQGEAAPLPAAPPAGDDWTIEAALDLDMASAACPSCNLVLVEADDDVGDGLFVGQNTAAALGTVVSDSWGTIEPSDAASLETFFAHPGVAIFAGTGDWAYNATQLPGCPGPFYPSTSPNVIAVGGTSLLHSTNTRGFYERAWSDAGSSCSNVFAKPAWQTRVPTCKGRMAADVSAVADPNTGVAVYNATYGGWIVVGGTSAATPLVAGIFARYGLGAVGSHYAYAHPLQFYDVHSGRNGACTTALCVSVLGWDGPTGMGTPNGYHL
jgi:hypothetical protein